MRPLLAVVAAVAGIWLAFQPAVANRLGYALPIGNGLPCRLHYRDRDYSNPDQCGGMNRSAWETWYDARHHVPSGGACLTETALRGQGDWPLQRAATVFTLLGAAHPVVVARRDGPSSGYTTMVLYVEDAQCYRPYALEGGP